MSDKPPLKRTKSGQSPAVLAFRAKLDSIREGTLPDLEKLNQEAAALLAKHKSDAPDAEPKDPPDPEDEEETKS